RIGAARRAEAEQGAEDEPPARSAVTTDIDVPTPPFWGTQLVRGVSLADYSAMLDERATSLGQWGLRGGRGDEGPSYEELVETEGRPRLRYWLDRLTTEGVLAHAAVVYGYFPCVAEGNDLVVLDAPEPGAGERHRFSFPRQNRGKRLCLADYFRPRELAAETGKVDVVPFQLVTMGQPIADYANDLFTANAYRDYLEVHGLGVQLTEALAEYWHARIRSELQLTTGGTAADDDAEDKKKFFDLDYRGARFSFGYGSCPDLEDRIKMVELLQPER